VVSALAQQWMELQCYYSQCTSCEVSVVRSGWLVLISLCNTGIIKTISYMNVVWDPYEWVKIHNFSSTYI